MNSEYLVKCYRNIYLKENIYCNIRKYKKKEKDSEKSLLPDLELLNSPQDPSDNHQEVPLWAGPFPLCLWKAVSTYQKPGLGSELPTSSDVCGSVNLKMNRVPGKQRWHKVKPDQISSPNPGAKPEPF